MFLKKYYWFYTNLSGQVMKNNLQMQLAVKRLTAQSLFAHQYNRNHEILNQFSHRQVLERHKKCIAQKNV